MVRSSARTQGPRLSPREVLLFEAGIKLGGVFHQYLGTPVVARTARGLARTIEAAVGLQPYVRSVRVRIDPDRGGPVGRGRMAYRYLNAEMLTVTVHLAHGNERVTATLIPREDLHYPLMSVASAGASVGRTRSVSRSKRTARRSARRTGSSAG
ncbi:MAG: dihydroneopterin aldolase family protein [Thermoplasmata archaeon]|nr:dihydroneopterin aldolase family protein [Thermoplasmata archaeon]